MSTAAGGPGPLIIKIGGSTLEDRAATAALWPALVSLHRGRPGGVVLVHGGGRAVDRQLDRLGFPTERREGLRITPEDQIDQVVGVLAGSVNKSLVGAINAARGRAVGLCLGDGALARCVKRTGLSFDPGRVGEVAGGDGALLSTLLAGGFLPVISSIGLDEAGRPLNVNADDAAAGLVDIIGASGLVLLTDVPGVMNGAGAVLHELSIGQCDSMISSGEISGGMIPKVRAAMRIASAGVEVVILSGEPGQLLAWIRGEPAGTRFTPAARRAATAGR
ncbi:MAG: acetylglutamate kinase [Phycisphaerales bacterium]|nr:acetylglutamate kinase [Phycisphaerales bacterium]